jgi:hypothetical protein
MKLIADIRDAAEVSIASPFLCATRQRISVTIGPTSSAKMSTNSPSFVMNSG